jgi:Asp-tRNA(Asn)/Glu-tRNA(Gln) amidotransferase A subunit family amidase
MLVGEPFDEPTICRAAYAFEQSGGLEEHVKLEIARRD